MVSGLVAKETVAQNVSVAIFSNPEKMVKWFMTLLSRVCEAGSL